MNGSSDNTEVSVVSGAQLSEWNINIGRKIFDDFQSLIGGIDDIRIYDRVLDLTEVGTIYNSGTGTEDTSSSSWESVTSGVAHTFTTTGTDLRWRATENSASTGEISEVAITSFH